MIEEIQGREYGKFDVMTHGREGGGKSHERARSLRDRSVQGQYCILMQRESSGNIYIKTALTVANIDFMKSELVLWSSNRIEEMVLRALNSRSSNVETQMLKVAAGLLEYPSDHDYIHVKGDIQPEYWLVQILQKLSHPLTLFG